MTIEDFEECHCSCHVDKVIIHDKLCCYYCVYCDRNINIEYAQDHEEKCKDSYTYDREESEY